MLTVNVRETRDRISQLLDVVAAGEEVIILRRGQPAARLVRADESPVRFPDRSSLRQALPPSKESAGDAIRALRDESRY